MPYGKGTYGSKVGRPKKKKTKVKDALYRGKIKKGPKGRKSALVFEVVTNSIIAVMPPKIKLR